MSPDADPTPDHDDQGCSGCGGRCGGATPEECRGPAPLPWLPFDRCMFFYEARVFDLDRNPEQRNLQVRVTYQHCLRLIGRQQGPLLYTTTLLPGETVQLYEFDRYRRVRSEEQRMSVQTSFRQTVSALSQSRRATSASAYLQALTDVRAQTDASVSAGGGLAGFLGAPEVNVDTSVTAETTVASGAATQTVSEQFAQFATTASQSTEAERSLVVSSFEDAEHQETTVRTLHNDNDCYATTYYVRRVNEAYEAMTRVETIEWRRNPGPWRSLDDRAGADDVAKLLEANAPDLPKVGEEVQDRRQITLPTDGTLYEAELAHCSSCEPLKEARHEIELEAVRVQARKACLEVELLALELGRRRALDAAGEAVVLDVGSWPLGGSGGQAPADAGPAPGHAG
jgi:thermitase